MIFTCELKPAKSKSVLNDNEGVKLVPSVDSPPSATFNVKLQKPSETESETPLDEGVKFAGVDSPLSATFRVKLQKPSEKPLLQETNDLFSKTDEENMSPAPLSSPKTERKTIRSRIFTNRKTLIQRIMLALLLCTITTGILVPVVRFASLSLSSDRSDFASISGLEGFTDCSDKGSLVDDDINDMYHKSCRLYEGGICDAYLKTDMHIVSTLLRRNTSEQDLIDFFNVLDNYPSIVSKECNEAAKPLLCDYVYPICDSNGLYQYANKEECVHVRDVTCAVEWQVALALVPQVLPNCDILPDEEIDVIGDKQTNTTSIPVCPKEFKLFCNKSCLPLCELSTQDDESGTLLRKRSDIAAGLLAIFGGILLITLSVLRRDSMFQYPAIFVVYTSLCPIILGILILISYIDTKKELYCTSEVVTETFSNPSAFCWISGVLLHFVVLLMAFFWFLHVFHIYFNLKFPLKSLIFKDKRKVKILHFSEISLSIFLSALGPGIVWLSNNEYNIFYLPPLLCLPASTSLIFYTLCLPLVILLTIGVNLIAMVLWTLFQKNGLFNSTITRKQCFVYTISTPEVKILILLSYFVVFSVVLATQVTTFIEHASSFSENLYAYYLCQLQGENPACEKLQLQYRNLTEPELASACFIMTGLINWVNLIFPIQFKDIKHIISRVSIKLHSIYRFTVETGLPKNSTSSKV